MKKMIFALAMISGAAMAADTATVKKTAVAPKKKMTRTYADSSANAAAAAGATSAEADNRTLLEKLKLSYTMEYFGPAIGSRPGDEGTDKGLFGRRPDKDGLTSVAADSPPAALRHSVIGGYKFTKAVSTDLRLRMSHYPDSYSGTPGQVSYTWDDPRIRLSDSKFITDGDFTLGAKALMFLPMSSKSQSNRMVLGAGLQFDPSYSMGALTLQANAAYVGYWYAQNNPGNASRDALMFLYPGIAYNLAEGFDLTSTYMMDAEHQLGEAPLNLNNLGTSLDVGFSWAPIKWALIEPSINFKTGGRIAADTTELGLTLTLTAL